MVSGVLCATFYGSAIGATADPNRVAGPTTVTRRRLVSLVLVLHDSLADLYTV